MELFNIGFISVRLVDIIDISIVTFLFYKLYNLLKGSIALRIVAAILAVFLLWKLVDLLDFMLLKSILDPFLGVGALALIVLFSAEIRRFLLLFAKNTPVDRLLRQVNVTGASDAKEEINELITAILDIRDEGLGALIVLTSNDALERYQETGDQLDAALSSRLLISIFTPTSPLHDGAVIITNHRIAAARCILPLSSAADLPPELGLRHRSAIGLCEVSNSLTIVISEERQTISLAKEGQLQRNLDPISLESHVRNFYLENPG